MKQLFVDYKTALLLQQLGFKEKCLAYYRQNKYKQKYHRITIRKSGILFPLDYKYGVVAPIHSQVQEWITKKYGIEIAISKSNPFEGYSCWCSYVDIKDEEDSIFLFTKLRNDYFEALNQGILEALEYIIKNNIQPITNEQ